MQPLCNACQGPHGVPAWGDREEDDQSESEEDESELARRHVAFAWPKMARLCL